MRNQNIQFYFAALLVVILVLITYSGASENEFVDWDDFTYVVNNDLVRNQGDAFFRDLFTTPVSSNYHPLTILSMRLNNNICETCPNGISPAPFIRTNVIIHILNSLLVLVFIFMLTGRNLLISFLVAIIFGVHPMHVESVAWIAERKDVLYTFFFLSGLITYLIYIKTDKRKYIWLFFSFLLFICSCLSKAVAVVFPVICILLNFLTSPEEKEKSVLKAIKIAFSPRSLLILLPFFLVSIFIGLMAYNIQNGENFLGMLDLSKSPPDVVNEMGPFSILNRFQIASFGFMAYIIKFFVPAGLSALYPYPKLPEFNENPFSIILWVSLASLILTAFLVIRSLRKSKIYTFSAGFYFITVVLVLQFITVGMAIMAERYTYLPYVGLALIPTTMVANSSGAKRKLLLIISACFIVMLIFISKSQIRVWSNTETLWSNVIEKHPREELPRRSRGKYYSRKSFQAKSESEKMKFENKALTDFTVAIKAGSKSEDVFEGAGVIYGSKGELENAHLLLTEAIKINPQKGSAYYNRALINDKLNRKDEAISDYNMALIYRPQKAFEIINNRSNLLLETGRFKEAAADYNYLISVQGNVSLYYYNRAYSKLQLKDIAGAIDDYRKVLQLNPGDKETERQLQALLDLETKKGVVNK